ncbi:MAG: NAD-dependent epimerase/dehydratase family protein [Promethearchaeia archaeon]
MSKKYKKSVLITGAAGFVGKHMVKEFLSKGYHVIACDINEEELKKVDSYNGDLEVIKIDMLKEDLIPLFKKVINECEEAYMINLAGLFKFDAPSMPLFLINAKLTKNVMAAALKVGGWKHIIHISTVGTYGTPAKNRKSSPWKDMKPYREDEPQIPDNTYGLTKYMGEKCAWRYYKRGLPISVVRPSLIYGPENRYGIGLFLQLASYCRNLMKGPLKYIILSLIAIPCRGGTYAHFVHVEDICRACSLILSRDDTIGEAYTIGDLHPLNTMVFFDLMLHCERIKMPWRFVPLSRFLIKHYDLIFNRYVTRILEKILKFCFMIYGWHMKYNPEEIPLEISKEWLGYFKSNFIWDISKLKKLGFKHKYPHMKKGVIENVIWYKKKRWLP